MLKFGYNWTNPTDFPTVQSLREKELIDYVEILLDNFIHHEPEDLLEILDGFPISFHIMRSEFLERNLDDLKKLGPRFKKWIKHCKPIYVSDHLIQFTYEGRLLYHFLEIDYQKQFSHVAQRVKIWQDLLETRIDIENYASYGDYAKYQPEFFANLIEKTNCGLFFDICNASVSNENAALPFSEWLNLKKYFKHMHIAGYSKQKEEGCDFEFYADTHDREIQPLTREFYKQILNILNPKQLNTLTTERDRNISTDSVADDIKFLKNTYEEYRNSLSQKKSETAA